MKVKVGQLGMAVNIPAQWIIKDGWVGEVVQAGNLRYLAVGTLTVGMGYYVNFPNHQSEHVSGNYFVDEGNLIPINDPNSLEEIQTEKSFIYDKEKVV